jgi:hypothetical protein
MRNFPLSWELFVDRSATLVSFETLVGCRTSAATDSGDLIFSACDQVPPAGFAQSSAVPIDLESPSVGTGHPRHLSAPPAQVTDTPVRRHGSGIVTRPNATKTAESTILRNGHSISIGTCGRELKWILDDEEDRAGA